MISGSGSLSEEVSYSSHLALCTGQWWQLKTPPKYLSVVVGWMRNLHQTLWNHKYTGRLAQKSYVLQLQPRQICLKCFPSAEAREDNSIQVKQHWTGCLCSQPFRGKGENYKGCEWDWENTALPQHWLSSFPRGNKQQPLWAIVLTGAEAVRGKIISRITNCGQKVKKQE